MLRFPQRDHIEELPIALVESGSDGFLIHDLGENSPCIVLNDCVTAASATELTEYNIQL